MSEQLKIEQQSDIPVIDGVLECPNQRSHLFVSKSAMLDWLKWSGVTSGTFRYGILQETGKGVYELVYNVTEN